MEGASVRKMSPPEWDQRLTTEVCEPKVSLHQTMDAGTLISDPRTERINVCCPEATPSVGFGYRSQRD